MAIIAYWSADGRTKGQTYGMAAVATSLAMSHNCKVLEIETSFGSNELEKCYWDTKKVRNDDFIMQRQIQIGLENSVEDLVRTLKGNNPAPETISNFAKIVFKNNRLDVLLAPKTAVFEEYNEFVNNYIDIISLANRFYDFVFIDISKTMPERIAMEILKMAKVINFSISQGIDSINQLSEFKKSDFYKKLACTMVTVQNADLESKYNKKNISRYLKEKDGVKQVPHNTLFFEACDESKISDFFLNVKMTSNSISRNNIFLKEIDESVNSIITLCNM